MTDTLTCPQTSPAPAICHATPIDAVNYPIMVKALEVAIQNNRHLKGMTSEQVTAIAARYRKACLHVNPHGLLCMKGSGHGR